MLIYKRVDPLSTAPRKQTKGAAGFDLSASRSYIIQPRQIVLVSIGIKVKIPDGYYGQIADRSGLALKHGIKTMGGVIDSDYRGIVGVILINLSDEAFEVKAGDRIAQLIIVKIGVSTPDAMESDSLDDTERGSGGFGSTGTETNSTGFDLHNFGSTGFGSTSFEFSSSSVSSSSVSSSSVSSSSVSSSSVSSSSVSSSSVSSSSVSSSSVSSSSVSSSSVSSSSVSSSSVSSSSVSSSSVSSSSVSSSSVSSSSVSSSSVSSSSVSSSSVSSSSVSSSSVSSVPFSLNTNLQLTFNDLLKMQSDWEKELNELSDSEEESSSVSTLKPTINDSPKTCKDKGCSGYFGS